MNKNANRKISAVLSYIIVIINGLSAFIYVPFITRILGQTEYGIYVSCTTIVGYLFLLDAGLSSSYIKFFSTIRGCNNNSDDEKKLNGLFLVAILVICLIALMIGLVLSKNSSLIMGSKVMRNQGDESAILMFILSINLALALLDGLFSAILNAYEIFLYKRVIQLFTTILKPALVILLLLSGFGNVAIVVITLVITIIRLISHVWYVLVKLKVGFIFKGIKLKKFYPIFSFSVFIIFQMIMDSLNWQVDKYIILRLRGPDSVAVYSIGSLFNMALLEVVGVISPLFIPQIFNSVTRNDRLAIDSILCRIGKMQFTITMYFITLYILFGKSFIAYVYGSAFSNSYYVGLVLIIGLLIPISMDLGTSVLRARNKHGKFSIILLGMAIGNVLISIPLCYYYGEIGSAVGTLVFLLICGWIIIPWLYKKQGLIDINRVWKSFIKPFFVGITAMLLGVLLLMIINTYTSILGWLVGIIIYTAIFGIVIGKFAYTGNERKAILSSRRGLE